MTSNLEELEEAPCRVCQVSTPMSRNTLTVDGLVCMRCQVTQPSPSEVRAYQKKRLQETLEEAERLKQILRNDDDGGGS